MTEHTLKLDEYSREVGAVSDGDFLAAEPPGSLPPVAARVALNPTPSTRSRGESNGLRAAVTPSAVNAQRKDATNAMTHSPFVDSLIRSLATFVVMASPVGTTYAVIRDRRGARPSAVGACPRPAGLLCEYGRRCEDVSRHRRQY